MTRNKRTKANLEQKITELYIKANKRQTSKLSRKMNLRKRLEFFKNLLNEEVKREQEATEPAPVIADPTPPAGE